MEKTDMLLKMLDSPKDYSEAQWDEILSDKECRELYNDIARIRGAVKANYNSLTNKEIAHEWQRLSGEGNFLEKPNGNRSNIFLKSWQRVAAIAAAVVVVSGFAYAAVSTNFFGIAPKPAKPAKVEQSAKPSRAPKKIQKEEAVKVAEPKLFDNVVLSDILAELSDYYGVEVEYKDEDVKGLRLYFEWNPDEPLTGIISTLNNFESFSIKLEGEKIIVSKAKQL
ncbi:MAG: DUF4974 domain-containing protein [Bacteroidales bacterium]|nr:DUF4974 domain-containing protein [Bacteroidales bacterium]